VERGREVRDIIKLLNRLMPGEGLLKKTLGSSFTFGGKQEVWSKTKKIAAEKKKKESP